MAGINNEGSRGLRSLLIATLLASWLAFCFRPVFHDFRGRWRYQRRRYTCTTRVICRGGYESGECPFGRNIILNDDIGGARGGARNRAPPAPPLPPPTYERVCNARGNENRWNRVWCGCVENVWAAVRTFHAFAAFPRCAPRNEIGRIFFRWGNEIFVLRQFLRDLKNCCWGLWFLLFGSNGVSWMKRRIICCWFFRKFENISRNCCLGIV